jgi:hypothetical protein
MPILKPGDNVAAVRLGSGGSNVRTEKGIMRPDARDLRNNVGGALSDPYYGNYPWIFPPPERITINRRGTIPSPAYGVQALVTSLQVPQAMQGVIDHVVCKFDGSGFQSGSGAVTWVIDINNPLGANLGYSPPDFSNITIQLGDFVNGLPWPIPGGIPLSERDTIRFKVTTVNPAGIGAPNLITCIFLGWYWPSRLQFPSMGRQGAYGPSSM